ncbi:hypothetical protein NL676_034749 [Syzygium grande]|nr:hypothetical protein NL676_034749 [Syzygium grande]
MFSQDLLFHVTIFPFSMCTRGRFGGSWRIRVKVLYLLLRAIGRTRGLGGDRRVRVQPGAWNVYEYLLVGEIGLGAIEPPSPQFISKGLFRSPRDPA